MRTGKDQFKSPFYGRALKESKMRPNAKKCATGIDVTQILRRSHAKKIKNFKKIGNPARGAQKVRGSRQRALRIFKETSLGLIESTLRSIAKLRTFGVERFAP